MLLYKYVCYYLKINAPVKKVMDISDLVLISGLMYCCK